MKKPNYYKIDMQVFAGNGGNGCISFRRERKVPKGGPDGGDGGIGGSVYMETALDLLTLNDLRYHRIWKAGNGKDGSSQNKSGKRGENVSIKVPIGTEVWDEDMQNLLLDITEPGEYLIASGGKGGLGNQHFTSAVLQAPSIATKGDPGEEKNITLVLKYMADIGLVGLPNAGKSTIVGAVSRAQVKIGDYPFSTINPVLGVVEGTSLVIADLPGLIEGAHMDLGLGHQFLQHLSRCRLLVHVIDSSDESMNNFEIIQNEIRLYDPSLLEKEMLVCLTKSDLTEPDKLGKLQKSLSKMGLEVLTLSQNDPASISKFVATIKAKLQQNTHSESSPN